MIEDSLTPLLRLIEERTGLAAGTLLRDLLEQHLKAYAMHFDAAHLSKASDEDSDWQTIVHLLTIGETYFLRGRAHFDALRQHILPRIIAEKRRQGDLTMRFLSLGCSTGEELYSLIITVHQLLADRQAWQITYDGVDLNSRALDSARAALYREWSFRHTEALFRQQYFRVEESGYRLNDVFRQQARFRQGNVLTFAPDQPYDLVLCRNVLLYFDKVHSLVAEARLLNFVTPAGWLLLGETEVLRHSRDHYDLHIWPGAPLYQHHTSTQHQPIIHHRERDNTADISLRAASIEHLPADYELAVKAIHADDAATAQQHLSQLLVEHPHHARAHVLLAMLCASQRALPEAEAHIEAALLADPLLADAHYIQALIALELGQKDEAEIALRSALYCQPGHALAAFMLGNLIAQTGDLNRASKQWQRARTALDEDIPHEYVSDVSDLPRFLLRQMLARLLDDEAHTPASSDEPDTNGNGHSTDNSTEA